MDLLPPTAPSLVFARETCMPYCSRQCQLHIRVHSIHQPVVTIDILSQYVAVMLSQLTYIWHTFSDYNLRLDKIVNKIQTDPFTRLSNVYSIDLHTETYVDLATHNYYNNYFK